MLILVLYVFFFKFIPKRDHEIVYAVLKTFQQLIVCEGIGIALENYYRQVLAVLFEPCYFQIVEKLTLGGA